MTRLFRRLSRKDAAAALLVIVIAAVLGWLMYLARAEQVHSSQISALSKALDAQRAQAQRAGQTPVAPPPSQILASPQIVRGDTGATGPAGPAGQNATDEQVRQAVALYFAANPPGPTPAAIAAAVANYLILHPAPAGPSGAPGPSGQNATPDQVAAAVRDYLVAHPPSPGPQGPAGPQGPGPTADQIAAAVRDYLTAHPLPLCPDGSRAEARTVVSTDGPLDVVVCVRQKTG